MARPAAKLDVGLGRENLLALGAMALLGALALAWQMPGRIWFDNLPVDMDKVRQARELIDPNTAGPASLRRLPGIGEVRARDIIRYRRQVGAFRSARDLMKIPGIGRGTIEKISPYLAPPGRWQKPKADDRRPEGQGGPATFPAGYRAPAAAARV